jgi:hypothetical protein
MPSPRRVRRLATVAFLLNVVSRHRGHRGHRGLQGHRDARVHQAVGALDLPDSPVHRGLERSDLLDPPAHWAQAQLVHQGLERSDLLDPPAHRAQAQLVRQGRQGQRADYRDPLVHLESQGQQARQDRQAQALLV